ncbi:MAG: carboxypeptidase regulatory-like domain-containing protein, partial [Candidatus Latescibacteria bacterium]|nr:carboxypeptidase regulatory-like domain-containing protein [Candidatus Latescibacterota bacterium]
MNSPVGEITSPAPVFSWQPNPGVPFYTIAVSDEPFVIEKENGEQKVKGVNAVWMATTPEVSLQYGQPDPSGSFTSSAPPLLPDKTYNWIVLNNYGNTLSTTSDVTSTPKDFWLAQEAEISAPQNMYPETGSVLNYEDNSVITFQWSQVTEAASYHIYLSEYREVVGGSKGFYPVWDAITSDPLIDLEARYLLINAKYTWKVIVEDAEGHIAASDTTSFVYDIPIATVDIKTRIMSGDTEQVLPYATVKIIPIDGSVDITPILIDDSGHYEKVIAIGTYIIAIEKKGYETRVDTLVLTEDPLPDPDNDGGDIEHKVLLSPSPAQFYGTVVDSSAGDIPVEGATVELTSADQTISTSTLSDVNGNFSIG